VHLQNCTIKVIMTLPLYTNIETLAINPLLLQGLLSGLALKAFQEMKGYLSLEPLLNYPIKTTLQPYHPDQGSILGGLSAILAQTNEEGSHCVLAYASRKLQALEKLPTPFLFKLQVDVWGTEHFAFSLKGGPFLFYSNQHTPSKLGKVHTKTFTGYRKHKWELPCTFERSTPFTNLQNDSFFKSLLDKSLRCFPLKHSMLESSPGCRTRRQQS
jgi:hypothetical protein